MLNISSTKGRLLEFAFYPSPAPGLPLYPFLGPDQGEKTEFCPTCMHMLGTTAFFRPKTAAHTKHRSQVEATGHCFPNTESILNVCKS